VCVCVCVCKLCKISGLPTPHLLEMNSGKYDIGFVLCLNAVVKQSRILKNTLNWCHKYLMVGTQLLTLLIYYTVLTYCQSEYKLRVNSQTRVSCWLIIRTGCCHIPNFPARKELNI